MFRKTILAITTVAAVSAAALVPASAGGGGNWGGKGYRPHFGFRTGIIVAAPVVPTCGLQYQWVQTRRGLVKMLIDTCTGLPY